MNDQTQQHRAIANALWHPIRNNQWQKHTVTRKANSHNPPGFNDHPTSPRFPNTTNPPIYIHEEQYITVLLLKGEHNTPHHTAAHLDRTAYELVLRTTSGATRYQFERATQTFRGNPFEPTNNRHGITKLRRNSHTDLITPEVATTLERIAATTTQRYPSDDEVDYWMLGTPIGTPLPNLTQLLLALYNRA